MKMLYGSGKLERKLIEEENRTAENLVAIRRYCPVCGSTNYVSKRAARKSCKVCGNSVFYDEKAEFKYKLGKRLLNANKRRTVPKNNKQIQK